MRKQIKALAIMALSAAVTLSMNAMTFAATTVGKVTDLKQTDSYSYAVDIAWAPQEHSTYTVQISNDKQTWTTTVEGLTQANCHVMGLDPSSDYYVRVQATSTTDATSTEWSDAIHVATATEATSNITQTSATESSATFVWDAVTNADSYNVYIVENGVEKFVGNTVTPNYTVTGLDNNTKYEFSVESVTATTTYNVVSGKATISSESINLVPDKVKNINVYDTKNYCYNVEVKDNNIYASEYEYRVYKYNKNKVITKWEDTASTLLANEKLNSRTFYKIKVRPFTYVNGNKVYGEWSDFKYFGLNLRLKASRTSDSTDITLSWKKMRGAKSYTIYISDKKKSGYKKVGTTKKNSFVITKFKKKTLKNKKYYVYVVANGKYNKKKLKSTVPYHKSASPVM